ncbi:MAG: hypothetical protein ACRESR_00305, partial [Gammaproteobacteria bacterium]
WSEPTLIEIGYGFEQATRARIRPRFLARVPRTASAPTLAELEGKAPPAVTASKPICKSSGVSGF